MMRRKQRERGVLLIVAGLWLFAVSSVAAIAFAVSRLTHTATEVQAVADAGALAGAGALVYGKDAYTSANNVAAVNAIDGKAASFERGDIVLGFYDPVTYRFIAGGAPQDAVQATAHARVNTVWGAIFGDPNITVTKQAVASYSPLSTDRIPGVPTLPVVVGSCFFSAFQTSDQCSQLPTLTQVPDPSNNSGWTSLQSGVQANKNSVSPFLPTACCGPGGCGGGDPPPLLTTGGDTGIGVQNGQDTPILKMLQSCVDNGFKTWIVPIVPCGQFNGDKTVLGFATVTITPPVQFQGNPKGINLSSICNTQISGPASPDNFGSGQIALQQ